MAFYEQSTVPFFQDLNKTAFLEPVDLPGSPVLSPQTPTSLTERPTSTAYLQQPSSINRRRRCHDNRRSLIPHPAVAATAVPVVSSGQQRSPGGTSAEGCPPLVRNPLPVGGGHDLNYPSSDPSINLKHKKDNPEIEASSCPPLARNTLPEIEDHLIYPSSDSSIHPQPQKNTKSHEVVVSVIGRKRLLTYPPSLGYSASFALQTSAGTTTTHTATGTEAGRKRRRLSAHEERENRVSVDSVTSTASDVTTGSCDSGIFDDVCQAALNGRSDVGLKTRQHQQARAEVKTEFAIKWHLLVTDHHKRLAEAHKAIALEKQHLKGAHRRDYRRLKKIFVRDALLRHNQLTLDECVDTCSEEDFDAALKQLADDQTQMQAAEREDLEEEHAHDWELFHETRNMHVELLHLQLDLQRKILTEAEEGKLREIDQLLDASTAIHLKT